MVSQVTFVHVLLALLGSGPWADEVKCDRNHAPQSRTPGSDVTGPIHPFKAHCSATELLNYPLRFLASNERASLPDYI